MSAHKDRLIQAADLLDMHPDDLLSLLDRPAWFQGTETQDRGPAPEGFAVFAHWSVSHDGINVEIDAPEGLPITVHVNDWRAVAEVIGGGEFPWADDEDGDDYGTGDDFGTLDRDIAPAPSEAEATR